MTAKVICTFSSNHLCLLLSHRHTLDECLSGSLPALVWHACMDLFCESMCCYWATPCCTRPKHVCAAGRHSQHFQTHIPTSYREKVSGSQYHVAAGVSANWWASWFSVPVRPVLPLHCSAVNSAARTECHRDLQSINKMTHLLIPTYYEYVKCESCCKTLLKIAPEAMIHDEM